LQRAAELHNRYLSLYWFQTPKPLTFLRRRASDRRGTNMLIDIVWLAAIIVITFVLIVCATMTMAFLEVRLTPRLGTASAIAAIKVGALLGAILATCLGFWLQLPSALSHVGLDSFAAEWLTFIMSLSAGMILGGLMSSKLADR
jgi:hypothetical protein